MIDSSRQASTRIRGPKNRGWRYLNCCTAAGKRLAVTVASLTFGFMFVNATGCRAPSGGPRLDENPDSLIVRAAEFRSLVERADYVAARGFMAPIAHRWWNERRGEGQVWRIGPEHRGPWAEWDHHFRSQKEIVEWKAGDQSATAVVCESNDYYRLLERGAVTNEITYFFDGSAQINGLLIRAVGERPPGRTAEFLTWAKLHEPDELSVLMPDGDIDPAGDHPQRFRRLLNRWRESVGLGAIE